MRKSRRRNKQRGRRSRTIKRRLQCGPGRRDHAFTCLSTSQLLQLRDRWNASNPRTPIRQSEPRRVWGALKSRYARCDDETCWVKLGGTNEMLDAFAPTAPKSWSKNPREWLSSTDILAVMRQYERRYPCFLFLGPSPIDFDAPRPTGGCVWSDLCAFDLSKALAAGKTKIGIIFNTDTSAGSGEHWISLFLDLRPGKHRVFYFDSVGLPAPPEVVAWVARVQAQGSAMVPPISLSVDQNYPVEHQYGDTECGIYALFFIAHMVEDKITMHYLKTHVLKDEYMHQFRRVYFNPAAEP